MGHTEVELAQTMIDGVCKLVEMSKGVQVAPDATKTAMLVTIEGEWVSCLGQQHVAIFTTPISMLVRTASLILDLELMIVHPRLKNTGPTACLTRLMPGCLPGCKSYNGLLHSKGHHSKCPNAPKTGWLGTHSISDRVWFGDVLLCR